MNSALNGPWWARYLTGTDTFAARQCVRPLREAELRRVAPCALQRGDRRPKSLQPTVECERVVPAAHVVLRGVAACRVHAVSSLGREGCGAYETLDGLGRTDALSYLAAVGLGELARRVR